MISRFMDGVETTSLCLLHGLVINFVNENSFFDPDYYCCSFEFSERSLDMCPLPLSCPLYPCPYLYPDSTQFVLNRLTREYRGGSGLILLLRFGCWVCFPFHLFFFTREFQSSLILIQPNPVWSRSCLVYDPFHSRGRFFLWPYITSPSNGSYHKR